MELKLVPHESFDSDTKTSVKKLIQIAEDILKEWEIDVPRKIEFYNTIEDFIQRILPQVMSYGLGEKRAREFIKASLNTGTYGTFNIEDNSIIEMNFHPYYKKFYPAIQFLRLLVHESLHLYLYSKLDKNIYSDKFKFQGTKYVGNKKLIQLDEGFANYLHKKILENFNWEEVKELPIFSQLNEKPEYKKEVNDIDIAKFNKNFNKIYEENSKIGLESFKKMFGNEKKNKSENIEHIIYYVKNNLEDVQ